MSVLCLYTGRMVLMVSRQRRINHKSGQACRNLRHAVSVILKLQIDWFPALLRPLFSSVRFLRYVWSKLVWPATDCHREGQLNPCPPSQEVPSHPSVPTVCTWPSCWITPLAHSRTTGAQPRPPILRHLTHRPVVRPGFWSDLPHM